MGVLVFNTDFDVEYGVIDTVTPLVRRVTAHIEAERCACDVRNPRGSCCLGDVAAVIERVTRDLSTGEPAAAIAAAAGPRAIP